MFSAKIKIKLRSSLFSFGRRHLSSIIKIKLNTNISKPYISQFLYNTKIDDIQLQQITFQPTSSSSTTTTATLISNEFQPKKGSLPFQIMEALQKLNIKPTSSKSHSAIKTCEEHFAVANDMQGTLVKNILVKSKRHKTQYLIIYPQNKQSLNLKVFGKYLGIGGGLRFVSDPSLTFQMESGSLSPLAIIFDKPNIVQCIIDDELQSSMAILVHPGTNSATIGLKLSDINLYLKTYGNPVQYLDINQFIGDAAKKTDLNLKKNLNKKIGKNVKIVKKGRNVDLHNEGITYDKDTQFGEWYKEIVTKCELIDYTDISGCYVLRPLAYFIWEQIQSYMNAEIQALGVRNAYFPLFVSEDALRVEAKHFDDFNPEVAWVTHAGNTKLDKKIAVRPTSETIIYPLFSKWIRSFRDLPMRINQWCNVVRWEFKNATPFLRTREFLWQEGHTAHATQESADAEVYAVLDMYAKTYEEICAIPMIKGLKTKLETFPGADYTTTVEGYIPGSGRGIQGATSHCLGCNFSKMFDITFLDEMNKKQRVIQNSWGFTTRSIGVMIMNHSDKHGLVLPPKCAMFQCVIIPIYFKCTEDDRRVMDDKVQEIYGMLVEAGVRCMVDNRDGKSPGFKFNDWELKGVPIRLEIGPRDMKAKQVMAARRDMRDKKGKLSKVIIKWVDVVLSVQQLLVDIHDNLYANAKRKMDENIIKCEEWKAFLSEIHNGKLVLAPHCMVDECEIAIAHETTEYFSSMIDIQGSGMSGKAKVLCIPLEQPNGGSVDESKSNNENSNSSMNGMNCVHCKKEAKKWLLFGRSY